MSQAFKRFFKSEVKALVAGILLLAPIYLAILMMLKAFSTRRISSTYEIIPSTDIGKVTRAYLAPELTHQAEATLSRNT